MRRMRSRRWETENDGAVEDYLGKKQRGKVLPRGKKLVEEIPNFHLKVRKESGGN